MEPLSLSGADGPVYRIDGNKVAKFEWNRELSDLFFKVGRTGEKVLREYEISKTLYDAGISVPKPEGVFMIAPPKNEDWGLFGFPKRFPAFVCQYIDGGIPTAKYLKPEEQRLIDKLVGEERRKVRKLGLNVEDGDGWENTLWVPQEQKIYLIDFSRWSK
jgi:hypothetical protein